MSDSEELDFSFFLDGEDSRSAFDKRVANEPVQNNGGPDEAVQDCDGSNEKELVLPDPVFTMEDTEQKEKFNAYRRQYRSFRKGKARGAKGEVNQFNLGNKAAGGKRTGPVIPPFLSKLFHMLQSTEYNEFIAWETDGASIVLKKVTEFSTVVLPKYFKHSNFASFLRQLNMYNFYTIHQEPNMRKFSNPLFRKDGKSLRNIKRKRVSQPMKKDSAPGPAGAGHKRGTAGLSSKSVSQRSGKSKGGSKKTLPNPPIDKFKTSVSVSSSNKKKLKVTPRSPPPDFPPDSAGRMNDVLAVHEGGGDAQAPHRSYLRQVATQSQGDVNAHLHHRLQILEHSSKLSSDEVASLKKDNTALKSTIKTQRSQIRSLEGNVKSLTATYKNLLQTVEKLRGEFDSQKKSIAAIQTTSLGDRNRDMLGSFDEPNSIENSLDSEVFM